MAHKQARVIAVCDQCGVEIVRGMQSHWDHGFTNPGSLSSLLSTEFSLHWCSDECMTQWYDEHKGMLYIDVGWTKP